MRRSFLIITSAAFLALVVLIVALAVNSILQLVYIDRQLNTIVEEHNRKIDLITQTQIAAHLRTDTLFRMVLTQDPFERDAIFMEFNRAAFQVGSGRNELRQLGFTPDEQRNFDQQTQLVGNIQALQEKIADLLNANRIVEARTLLDEQAIPLQNKFNLQLAQMRTLYQGATSRARNDARQTFESSMRQTIGLGITAALMGVLGGLLTLWQLSRTFRQIEQHLEELEVSRAALKQEASHDSLTGLANRRLLYDRLQQAIRHARRYGGKVGVLFVDLDHFKEINDTYGHHVGDAVLTEVAQRLAKIVRESDSIARLGGDEFVVLLDNVRGRDDCLAAAIKIEQTLAENSSFYGLSVEIAASIGQAMFPDDGDSEDALIRAADAAMYRVKSGAAKERQRRFAFNQ